MPRGVGGRRDNDQRSACSACSAFNRRLRFLLTIDLFNGSDRMLEMTVNDLERRFDYGYWANARLFAVISQLTTEQFTQNVAGSYGSIRNTLVHALSTEWGWLARCGG